MRFRLRFLSIAWATAVVAPGSPATANDFAPDGNFLFEPDATVIDGFEDLPPIGGNCELRHGAVEVDAFEVHLSSAVLFARPRQCPGIVDPTCTGDRTCMEGPSYGPISAPTIERGPQCPPLSFEGKAQ